MRAFVIFAFTALLATGCFPIPDPGANLCSPSRFVLPDDLTNFKSRLGENDTLLLSIDLSVCLFEGVEKMIITRRGDSIHVTTEYSESVFSPLKFEAPSRILRSYDTFS